MKVRIKLLILFVLSIGIVQGFNLFGVSYNDIAKEDIRTPEEMENYKKLEYLTDEEIITLEKIERLENRISEAKKMIKNIGNEEEKNGIKDSIEILEKELKSLKEES